MSEYLDVLDEHGRKTGQRIEKKRAHKEGVWHAAVHVWITDGRGRLLLQRRSIKKDSYPGLWDVSAAGHVSAGETPEQAAIRETQEEIGATIAPHELEQLGVERLVVDKPDWHNHEFDTIFFVRHAFPIEKLARQKTEVDEIVWRDATEIIAELDAHPERYVPNMPYWRRMLARIIACARRRTRDPSRTGRARGIR